MSKTYKTFLIVLGLFFYGSTAYALYRAADATIRLMSSVDSQISTAIIAGAVAVIVSVMSIVVGKVYESRARVEKENRDKKITVYEDLLNFMSNILMGVKGG